ncbi:hypothetical protein TBLA_0C03610 [Henningerozyma blattae CBS 6284]|uniref:Major facilitator superfamily (MFS) profile domain-containing protein n=1 Tax=Henningerozyma blattae (strain ATCC 34711 / CBS 6284 / DSM 70876 / NBRC 10599 / NRRL Y-10934 / UCD 77-7) TaxID=1071380 RepID=I2H1B1_HENB6|nr:hypothetical protein TBLA_0C03610 [Tetrapisispora blattae CBS 6284]CCH60163.1 hypothetical protein TBLA_0C03610 [Tetrapisispora blattae CBS 6284]
MSEKLIEIKNESSSSINKESSKISVISTEYTSSSSSIDINNEDTDVALKFLKENKGLSDVEAGNLKIFTDISETAILHGTHQLDPKILRKVDFVILPFLCVTYLFMFLDKALLNYAAAMGINDYLKDNEFSNLGTIFSAAYIFMEPIVTFLIQRFPLSKVLGTFICLWGAVLACHSACKTYASLMIVRTLLGIFESSSAVGCIAISGMYYTKSEQSARIGYWAIQAGTGYVVGGLISFGFLHYHGTTFLSWQIMFLIVGLATVVFGIIVCVFLPDNVTKAYFLTAEEKIQVLEHIRNNQTGLENKKFKKEQVKELFLKDKLTWPMLIMTVCSQISTGAIGNFSTTITGTFGFDSYESALLQLPIGAITALIIFITTQMLTRWGKITLISISMEVVSIIGCIVMLTMSLDHKIANLFSLYLLYSGSCVITNIYIWNTWNTSGYCKRIFRNASTMVMCALANIIGPQMFRASTAPRYIPAKIALLVTQSVCIPLQFYIGWVCKKENEKRDNEMKESIKVEDKGKVVQTYEFLDLTDIQNRNFRYIY